MLQTQIVIENGEARKGDNVLNHSLKSLKGVMLRPGAFFQRLPEDVTLGRSVFFLTVCSAVFSAIAALLTPGGNGVLAGIYIANAFLTPWIMAVVFYLASIALCRNRFTFQTIFGITAYASVTLLVSWIPGIALFAGLWRFYLIGLGLVKAGGVSVWKAFGLILVTAAILLVFIQWLQPFQRN